MCAGEQARAGGFAAELLSLGLPLHLWLFFLRLSAVLASQPGHGADTTVWAVPVWFPSSWPARQTLFFVFIYFFRCWLRNRFVSRWLLRGEAGDPGWAWVRVVGGEAMGLGLCESGLLLDWGWHDGAWHAGVYPRAGGSGTGRCPGFFGTQEGVGRHLAGVEVWPCRALAVACPVGPPAASVYPVRGLPPPAQWHVPGPAEGCHRGCCWSEVMQQGAVGAVPPDEEKPIGVEVWDTLQQGWSGCGV